MLLEEHQSSRRSALLIAGTMALNAGLGAAPALASVGSPAAGTPPAVTAPAPAGAPSPTPAPVPAGFPAVDSLDAALAPLPAIPTRSCLADAICAIKDKVRWRSAAWSPSFCELMARAVLDSAKRYDLHPALILAVMINESDMQEKAFLPTLRNGEIYAKDSGLMGIRCVVDKQGRCANGHVRGLPWRSVMDPVRNIELGARELARWRDGGGITTVTVRRRSAAGHVTTQTRRVPCEHRTHAYWAHYNHGPRYIDKGRPRHYPHRIAVLYHAVAQTLAMNAPELTGQVTMRDPGARARTPDRPVEARYRGLCEKIRSVGSVCAGVAALDTPVAPSP